MALEPLTSRPLKTEDPESRNPAAAATDPIPVTSGDLKLRSSCVVMVENLAHKQRRPVHPTTPTTSNTSPLAAKSPLDISSPALPTTSTLSEAWRHGSPRHGSPRASQPSPAFSQAVSAGQHQEDSQPSPAGIEPSPTGSPAATDPHTPSDTFQVTNYRAIFSKQENAKSRSDLKTETNTSPTMAQVASPTVAPPTVAQVASSTVAQGASPTVAQVASPTVAQAAAESTPMPALVATLEAGEVPAVESRCSSVASNQAMTPPSPALSSQAATPLSCISQPSPVTGKCCCHVIMS